MSWKVQRGLLSSVAAIAPGAAAAWTPASLSTLPAIWFDAQDGATITQSGGNVSQVSDKSGNALHATQATGANQPAYSSTGFDGSRAGITHTAANAHYFLLPSLAGTGWTAAEVFYVAKRNADPPATQIGAGPLLVAGTQADVPAEVEPFTDSNIYIATFSTVRKSVGNPTPSLASSRIINIQSASGAWTYVIDTTQHFTTATNTVGLPSTPRVGYATFGGNDYYFDGVWGELLVVPAILSTPDREKVEGYLAHRWGLAGNLPGGHTYKSAPP